MSSTEALDQVAEDTSKLDISTENNGPTNPPKQDRQESQQEIPPTVETENDGKSSQKEERAAPSRKDSQKDETASRKNSETTTSRKNSETADESGGAKPTVKSLPKGFRDSFRAFAKFGDTKSDGKSITLSQSDKWMKQAKVIEGKKLTTTDTGIYFKKFKSLKIGLSDYHKFIQSLVQSKGLCEDDLVQKMADCGAPGTNINTASPGQIQDTITRLTDPSKYTGSHKLRFDEAGKGKGLAGRKDVADGASAGYVHGYQNRNSYDKTH